MDVKDFKLVDGRGNVLNDDMRGKIAAAKTDAEKLLKHVDFKTYASAMVLGNQLYAWGHYYVLSRLPGSQAAKHACIDIIKQSLENGKGQPRAFDERQMAKLMGELTSKVKNLTKQHGHERDSRVKLANTMVKEATKEAAKPESRL